MIVSFACGQTELLFRRQRTKKFPPNLQRVAYRKLVMIDAATRLDDLRTPPGNRLEAIKGDRRGQYSIRINDQWRVCFHWVTSNAADVEIVDYH